MLSLLKYSVGPSGCLCLGLNFSLGANAIMKATKFTFEKRLVELGI